MSAKISQTRFLGDSSRLPLSLVDPNTGEAFDPAGHLLIFTLKLTAALPDTEALVQKISTVGGITLLTAPDIEVELVPDDFVKLKADIPYDFDVQAQEVATGAIKTVARGTLTFDEDVTKGTNISIPTHTTNPVAVPIGEDGIDGWSPVFALVADGARRVLQVADWQGGEGDKPAVGKYVGAAGLVDLIANGVDIRGIAGADGADGADGINGADGNDGWSPVLAIVADGARRVQQVVDWQGGEGAKPAVGRYVGLGGLVVAIADGVDIRGAQGAAGADGADGADGAPGNPGADGADGNDGWSPVLAIVADGARRVQQVVDWQGGEGAKPATGRYVGIGGLVVAIADGVDIRGPQGAAGADGADGANGADGAPGTPGADGADGADGAPGVDGNDGWSPVLAIVADGARRVQQVVDWQGGEGAKPATGRYVGIGGLVVAIADGVDIRGPQGPDGAAGADGADGAPGTPGADGAAGADGSDGWSPELAVVTDGARRVLQVVDWQGGEGAKPAVGKYIGAAGLVDLIADGVDVRGAAGAGGGTDWVAMPADGSAAGAPGQKAYADGVIAEYIGLGGDLNWIFYHAFERSP